MKKMLQETTNGSRQIEKIPRHGLVTDVENPVDLEIIARRKIRNVVDFDVETDLGSCNLEMLSLKE